MIPWGAIIGLAGQATSGVLSILNNKRMQRQADEEAARQQSYYDAMANENPLARSEVQHMLGQYDRESQRQMENARNLSKITGASPEFASAVQKGVAEGRANMMGNITAGASARADRYKQMGEIAKHQKAMEDQERRMARNATYAALAGNAASAVGAIMDGYSAKMPKAEAPSNNNQKLATGGAQIKTPEQIEAQAKAIQTVTDETKPMSARIEASKPLVPGFEATMQSIADNMAAQENHQKLAAAQTASAHPNEFIAANQGIYADPYDNYLWLHGRK